MNPVSFLHKFPKDLFSCVVDLLSPKNVGSLACVCQSFNSQCNWPGEFRKRILQSPQNDPLLPILKETLLGDKAISTAHRAERIPILYHCLKAVSEISSDSYFIHVRLQEEVCLFTKIKAVTHSHLQKYLIKQREDEIALAYIMVYKNISASSARSFTCFKLLESKMGFSRLLQLVQEISTPDAESIFLIPLIQYGIHEILGDQLLLKCPDSLRNNRICKAFSEIKDPFPAKTAQYVLRRLIVPLETREEISGSIAVKGLYQCLPLDFSDPYFEQSLCKFYEEYFFEEEDGLKEIPHPAIAKSLLFSTINNYYKSGSSISSIWDHCYEFERSIYRQTREYSLRTYSTEMCMRQLLEKSLEDFCFKLKDPTFEEAVVNLFIAFPKWLEQFNCTNQEIYHVIIQLLDQYEQYDQKEVVTASLDRLLKAQ